MDAPQPETLLIGIEQLQDEVLRGLEDLNCQVERTLRECQTNLKLIRPVAEVPT